MNSQSVFPIKIAVTTLAVAATALLLVACGKKEEPMTDSSASMTDTNMAPPAVSDGVHPAGRGSK
jgi:hypothetical protein